MNGGANGRGTVLVALAAAVALVAIAGDRFAAQTPFRSGIDLVEADAVVVDAQGHPAVGLTSADFKLSVDGSLRDIESVEYIDTGDQPAPAGEASASNQTGRTRSAQRHVVFVADEGSISAGTGHSAVQAARQLLDQLGPSNRVALLSIPSGSGGRFHERP